MAGIIISLIIGVLLGYIGAGDHRGLVWVVFALMAIMILINARKLDITAFLAIILGGIGLLATQQFAPEAFHSITSWIEISISGVTGFFKSIYGIIEGMITGVSSGG